jgi:hypothetical protein
MNSKVRVTLTSRSSYRALTEAYTGVQSRRDDLKVAQDDVP